MFGLYAMIYNIIKGKSSKIINAVSVVEIVN